MTQMSHMMSHIHQVMKIVLDFSWLMVLSEGVQVNGFCFNDQMFSLFYNMESGINVIIINEI
jgi:hypothetical protein